ncbi:MAG: hypothetical protein ACPHLK_00785 [Gammaproteobacteria bacterium]|jgi:hypothetical protein
MHSKLSDTHPEIEKIQLSLIREANIAKRISLVRSLSQTTIQLSRRAIARANPELSDKEVDIAFVASHYGSDLADRLKTYISK